MDVSRNCFKHNKVRVDGQVVPCKDVWMGSKFSWSNIESKDSASS